MDGAEVATNCACTTRSCPTCWCPDNMLSSTQNTHKYRRVAEVLSELDSAREELLDDDGDLLPGCVGDAKAAEKRIRHKLLPEMHGCLCHTSSCLCPVQKTNCTNGINFGISPFQTGLSLIFCGISYILIGLSLR